MAAFLAYCYPWNKFCPFMLSSFYILTITLFRDYILLMLHAFMHAHILKAFYALWHIIAWFAGGAESRRAELGMFLESACSVSHNSISLRHRDGGRAQDGHARWQAGCSYHVCIRSLFSQWLVSCEAVNRLLLQSDWSLVEKNSTEWLVWTDWFLVWGMQLRSGVAY